ncbi:MAG TPA: hypothetical protein PK514_10015 [Spirochaetota bacterium]|nr:hypothetical protein [Spirochaetota bacterium]
MDYKKEMKMLMKGRERYFPVIDALLDMKTADGSHPLSIDDPDMMRTVLELIDIGYFDPDAFIINQRFGEVRGLYYKGGPVLTDTGWTQYKMHHSGQRKNQVIRIFIILSIIWLAAAFMLLIFILK